MASSTAANAKHSTRFCGEVILFSSLALPSFPRHRPPPPDHPVVRIMQKRHDDVDQQPGLHPPLIHEPSACTEDQHEHYERDPPPRNQVSQQAHPISSSGMPAVN